MGTEHRAPGRLRVAVVGPAAPHPGGVSAHTTELARRLAVAGNDTLLVSWSRLYPRLLYPGQQVDAPPVDSPVVDSPVVDAPPVDAGQLGVGGSSAPSPRVVRPLRWDRPGTWWRTGARLRSQDVVVVVAVVPVQVPALLTLIRSVRAARPASAPAAAPRVVVLAHNVVPHETHPGDRWLMGRLLRTADAVLVHSPALADQAEAVGARRVLVAALPPHLPGSRSPGPGPSASGPSSSGTSDPGPSGSGAGASDAAGSGASGSARPDPGGHIRVLALGIVRDYKGFDLLLEAAAQVPEIEVTVAGEQWGRAGERLRALAEDPRLAGRVHLDRGYVPDDRIDALLSEHDVLALPYRHGTASQNVLLGHAHGVPVLVSRAGTLADGVRDGIDGLVVPPGDSSALTAALAELARPGRVAQLRRGVPAVDLDAPWRDYLHTLLADPARPDPVRPDPVRPDSAVPDPVRPDPVASDGRDGER